MRIDNLLEKFPETYKGGSANGSLTFADLKYPVSISRTEFDFIYSLAYERKFKLGYEVATGTGCSAIAFAAGLRDSNQHFSKIVSLDSYVEAESNSLSYYGKNLTPSNEFPAQFNKAREVSAGLGLTKYADFRIGKSPNDVKKVLGERSIDYIFIDAEHTDDALLRDFNEVSENLSDKFVLLIHDSHCFTKQTLKWIGNVIGVRGHVPEGCAYPGGGFNLMVFDKK